MSYFIAGIGTEVGKTIVSSVLVETLQADYWKPVQAGNLEYTDSDRIRNFIRNKESKIFPEAYRFNTPLSPHIAAKLDQIQVDFKKIVLPSSKNLIVEGAGGVMTPLNENQLNSDLIQLLKLPIILVSRHYLGSINHTLLTIDHLFHRDIKVRGIVFFGQPMPGTEEIIMKRTQLPVIARIVDDQDLTYERLMQNRKELSSL